MKRAASTGFVQRAVRGRLVGLVGHWNRWTVVWGGCMAEGTGGLLVWFEPGPVRQQVLTVAGPKLAKGPPSTSG